MFLDLKSATAGSKRWIRWPVLLTAWTLSFLSFIIVTRNNELNKLYNNKAAGPETGFIGPKNQTGALSYWRCEPKANGRLIHSVDLKNLRAENNNLGIFRTALHKVVTIDGLQLEFHRYTSPEGMRSTSPDIPAVLDGVTADVQPLIDQISHKLTDPMRGWRLNSIDLGNVSEVHVENFDYRAFHDGDLFFRIQSRRAIASYKRSGIILRGRVTLETADGSTLKGNHVTWDVEKQHFIVNGVYVLDRGGVRTTGKDICVDAQLNRIGTVTATFKCKEEQKCLVKL